MNCIFDNLIGWILSIISICIAIYQYKDKKKYEDMVKINNWIIFQRINNLGGVVQKLFNESIETNIDKSLYEKIVRSDALAAELYKEAIRLVMISENKVTEKEIEKWEKEGRIAEGYSKIFKGYLPK